MQRWVEFKPPPILLPVPEWVVRLHVIEQYLNQNIQEANHGHDSGPITASASATPKE
jgi:hypothetical protein